MHNHQFDPQDFEVDNENPIGESDIYEAFKVYRVDSKIEDDEKGYVAVHFCTSFPEFLEIVKDEEAEKLYRATRIKSLSKLNHPNLATFCGSDFSESFNYFRCPPGYTRLIEALETMNKTDVKLMFSQILDATAYLHS